MHGVIAGFEPLDILQGIYMLIKQIERKKPRVEIQYNRLVKPEGNVLAQAIMKNVFSVIDEEWRGFGIIPKSGLAIKKELSAFNAEKNFTIKVSKARQNKKGCVCAQILKGLKTPLDCKLFGRACTPDHPYGPCMVSSEGTCSASYLSQQ